VQLAPPGVIDIGLVEDVSATRLDRLSAAGHHVVDGGRLGALTRLAAIPLIIVMVVAIVSTKLPIWAGQDVWIFHLPKLPRYGFWSMAHEARADFTTLLGSLYLLIEEAGAWSLDAMLARRRSSRHLREE